MAKVSRRGIAALALAGGLCALLGFAPQAAAYSEELPRALRGGGLVILVRHVATFAASAKKVQLPRIREPTERSELWRDAHDVVSR